MSSSNVGFSKFSRLARTMRASKFKRQPRRFLVDASHTLPSGLNTGVQRVVRNTCNYAPLVASNLETDIVVSCRDGFQTIGKLQESPAEARLISMKNNVVAHLPKMYVRSARLLCNQFPSKKLANWLLPQPGHKGIFKLPLKCMERMTRRSSSALIENLGHGDVILLPDAYWAHAVVWEPVARARRNGAFIATLVYDLIPLTHPDFVSAGAPESFREYLKQVAKHSDLIVAISNTVRDEVVATLPQILPDQSCCTDIRSFQLGAEFSQADAVVRPEVKEIFQEDSTNCPYLMVATFDPRKNHTYLLDAFEKIWERDPSLKLCMIGRVGWLCDDVIDRVTSHARFGKQLFMLNDASDGELNYCYQRARAIVFPSIVEGFGLPIVEALWHGRYVFASDTTIHREVGGSDCYYFDLADPMCLANQVIDWEATLTATSPTKQTHIKPLTWRQSVEQLVQQCLDSYAQSTACTADRTKTAA